MDMKAAEFIDSIIIKMISEFGITKEEAYGRVNERWKHLGHISEDDIIFHETEEFWAYDIYYGHDSRWWARMNDKNLKPVPHS